MTQLLRYEVEVPMINGRTEQPNEELDAVQRLSGGKLPEFIFCSPCVSYCMIPEFSHVDCNKGYFKLNFDFCYRQFMNVHFFCSRFNNNI